MGKSRRQAVTLLAMLLAFCGCAFALDPSLDISQYGHTSWKIRDGFAKGSITALAQTPNGYLWLGTDYGLLRFDGVRAVRWQPPAGEKLPSDAILSLLQSRDGAMWIGTRKGLVRWKDGKITTYPELAGRQVFHLLEDREGAIWAGTIQAPNDGRLCEIRSEKATCVGADGSVGPGVTSLYEDSKGNFWVGGFNGFWRWKPGPPKFFPTPGESNGVRAFIEDSQGALLFPLREGMKRLVNERIQPYPVPGLPLHSWLNGVLRDRDGALWLGTVDQGLVHIHNGMVDSFSEGDGFSSSYVSQVLEDHEGNIWTATLKGLDRFRPYSISSISSKQGLSGSAWSVLAANDGSILIGTTAGLTRWNQGRMSIVDQASFKGAPPESLFQDRNGRLWITTIRQLGYIRDGRFAPSSGYPQGYVHGLVEDRAGDLWIANQQAGMIHLKQGALEQTPWSALGRKDFAMSLVADPSKSGLWLGFFLKGGVAYYEEGRIRTSYSTADGLGNGLVNDLRFGPDGALWAATEGGLSRIKDGHISTLTSKNGMPCDTVHWSMEDDDHAAWLFTPCGLVRITRRELDAWVADPRKNVETTVFDESSGVQSYSIGGGYRPIATKTHDGKIWFITFDAVSVIDPHHFHENKLPPPVHIENITADDKTVEVLNGMHLPTGVRHVDIDYTALSLVVPEKVRFRIKLEGEDKDWRELVNIRHVEYTNLPPKHYKFRVLACNNSGVWNEEGAALEFVIPPAWYQTNWFRAACVALFVAMLWGTYELRVRQLAHEFNMGLEQRVAERTRVARELHDTLLQSFQALLPLLQAGINMFGSRPADALRTFEKAADHASQAIAEGRDAIQGMRMSTVEKNDLAVAIRTLGEELASAAKPSSPNFTVVVEGTSRNLHPILRDEVYRLTTEALRNAFRHAAAQNVEVEIRYDEKYFRLRIRDDGKGIPSDVLSGDGREGHYGLPGMRERAKLVGGKLTIWTEVDGGTEIELNIPGARAFVKSARPFWYFGKHSATETDEKEPIERE